MVFISIKISCYINHIYLFVLLSKNLIRCIITQAFSGSIIKLVHYNTQILISNTSKISTLLLPIIVSTSQYTAPH